MTPSTKKKKKKKSKHNKLNGAKHNPKANTTVVHFNMNLGGVSVAIHYLRKFRKQFPSNTLIVNLVETGIATEEEADSLTGIASDLGFASAHAYVTSAESNLILQARLAKKQDKSEEK